MSEPKFLGTSVACQYGSLPNSLYIPDFDIQVQTGWDASPTLKSGQRCWVYQITKHRHFVSTEKLKESEVAERAEAVMKTAIKKQDKPVRA